MILCNQHTALLLIDIQQGFRDPVWGKRNNDDAERNAGAILTAARNSELLILHVQHASTDRTSPLHPPHDGFAFAPEVVPHAGEPVFKKSVNSAFIGTDLDSYLREREVERLLIAGITTNHCVSTSVRMAANLGFTVYLIEDACTAFDRVDHSGRSFSAADVHALSVANLHDEFAKIVKTEDVVRSLKHAGSD